MKRSLGLFYIGFHKTLMPSILATMNFAVAKGRGKK